MDAKSMYQLLNRVGYLLMFLLVRMTSALNGNEAIRDVSSICELMLRRKPVRNLSYNPLRRTMFKV